MVEARTGAMGECDRGSVSDDGQMDKYETEVGCSEREESAGPESLSLGGGAEEELLEIQGATKRYRLFMKLDQ